MFLSKKTTMGHSLPGWAHVGRGGLAVGAKFEPMPGHGGVRTIWDAEYCVVFAIFLDESMLGGLIVPIPEIIPS